MRDLISLLLRVVHEEEGQDLIEYALLTAIIGIAGIAAYAAIRATMKTSYEGRVQSAHTNWHPSDPQ